MSRTSAAILREVLESLQPYPQMQFLLFAQEWGPMEEEMLAFCREQDHTLLLYGLGELSGAAPLEDPRLRHRPYRIEQPRYNLQGKLYNHAFVTAAIPDEAEAFARKLYTGIVNAGGLYLRTDPANLPRWQAALEGANYVAASSIPLSEKSLLLYARKMHGWGG